MDNTKLAGKYIVASEGIKYSDVVDKNNITVKRPGASISPMLWDTVPGRTVTQKYAADDLITL